MGSKARLIESSRLASVGELAAGVAHEINNPLAAIILVSEFLGQFDLPEEASADVKIIIDAAQRAARIVQNMLHFARKTNPVPERSPIDEIVRRALELKAHDFKQHKIESHLEVEAGLPECLVDKHQLGQVIHNVLNNAEHALATHQDGGNISIDIRSDSNFVALEIKDDGPGIDPDSLSKVFEPFFTTKPAGEGTGLGLSICYGIIKQHGGDMWAANNDGAGTSIMIQLPIAREDFVSRPVMPQPEEHADTSMSKLLVVDDEPTVLGLISRALRDEFDFIGQASGGEAALEMIRESDYDCILLDLNMLGINGKEVFERVAAADPGLADRIIFMTADTAREESAVFLAERTNPVIVKPFELAHLRQVIASVLSATHGG